MNWKNASLWWIAGSLLGVGSVTLSAQAPSPAAVQDPISPADCLRDKTKAPECQRLGVQYVTGTGVTADVAKGLALLDAACRAGLPMACQQHGWFLLQHQTSPEDAARGIAFLEGECKAHDADACAALGEAYASGTGVPRNAHKAVKALEQACGGDRPQACLTLAGMLEAGDGVGRDEERAKRYMAQACALGSEEACLRQCESGVAGSCFSLGMRTSDKARALPLLEKGCSLGLAPSCAVAASRYYIGLGVSADRATAVRLYAKACANDAFPIGCATLAAIYARGEMGEAEKAKAADYFARACRGDGACLALVAEGKIPEKWGGSLEALRPHERAGDPALPRVGGQIKAPRKIRDVRPAYPAKARSAGVQGTVVLECVIDKSGSVADTRVIEGIPFLTQSAIDAVRRWRYTPTLLAGKPVPVIMTVNVSFKIS